MAFGWDYLYIPVRPGLGGTARRYGTPNARGFMRTPLILLVSLIVATACEPPPAEDEGPDPAVLERFDDPEVARIWSTMMDSIAPDDGWEETRWLRFDFVIDRGEGPLTRRSHRWAVWEGDYRVEAPVGGDERMVALFNVNHPAEGERIWIDGEEVADAARSDSLAQRAHGMFVNDSYWLLMPFKWADDGVHATYLGRMEEWGETYDVVELTFEGVGLTPQNKYRAFVDTASGMMELWQHFRDAGDEEPGFTLAWTDWERHGPILLSPGRPDRDGASTIRFENLDAATSVPEDAFAPPGG